MANELEFNLSVLKSETLEEQANRQRYTLESKKDFFEDLLYSIHMTGFHVATESQVKSMLNKFFKKLESQLVILKESENDAN